MIWSLIYKGLINNEKDPMTMCINYNMREESTNKHTNHKSLMKKWKYVQTMCFQAQRRMSNSNYHCSVHARTRKCTNKYVLSFIELVSSVKTCQGPAAGRAAVTGPPHRARGFQWRNRARSFPFFLWSMSLGSHGKASPDPSTAARTSLLLRPTLSPHSSDSGVIHVDGRFWS